MAPNKRKSLGIEVPRTAATLESPPGIAALFAIRFDIKTGYVIAWKRSISDVEVEGVVEYKSLPSGLHNVTEDLVYFVHEEYAGLSAFINLPAEEAERNAKMFAVGVLVPLSFGRLGKSWRHAPKLKELVQQYAQDTSNNKPLDEYWDTYQVRGSDALPSEPPLDSPISVRSNWPGSSHRNRAFSDAMVLEPSSRPALTPFHPASSLPHFVDSFGPLIFPLYRAALLRKRILLMTEAPVHVPCNYVYDLSLLASLPDSVLPLLPQDNLPTPRLRPLFNIGIHDIPYLSSFIGRSPRDSEQDSTWIACSTDSVLTMKPELFDVLATVPAPYTKDAAEKIYPKLTVQAPSRLGTAPVQTELRATQRDARRYTRLRQGLRHLSRDENSQLVDPSDNDGASLNDATDDNSDTVSTFSSSPVVEPLSWAQLAYTSFIWWASAGEKREGLSEEEEEQQIEQDTRLLASAESLSHPNQQPRDTEQQPPEVALVAYFRRLTAQIFIILTDVVARHDSDGRESVNNNAQPYSDDANDEDDENPSITMARQSTQEGDDDRSALFHNDTDDKSIYDSDTVLITTEDMTEMGLDVWSATDRVFAEELVRLWWGRQARIDSARIRCCGITIL
ncbi:uncharacterized protein EURHEDRAFT_512287 [Aspergillus ruber CBS 135680]|uniref:DUF4484 domain-containing protein n=1 Tax=Aspergillus ruber (strain CBS 135680) TaxID=1388766 RepID=A0A017SRU3_ASPRC|nr:uncharacterized protein EURHEDRAFT_512287 [Aspergillus ruber CBS 135680]EYE98990.1 hypothetical protein EURHEDRAFT_512287 [Aspergillus ruber CBS 135680]